MKLVEILARELNQWRGDWLFCAQSSDGQIYFDNEERDQIRFERGAFLAKASDWKTARVTRAQWEAERARIAGINEQYTFHPGEAIMPPHFDLPRYEQELWDKVALKTLAAQIQKPQSIAADVGWCADVADAFMAERAKRMKK